jgi:hypothetical protein
MCAIGMLAAPITLKVSKTYFNNPARNTIFIWTGLILAGEWPRSDKSLNLSPHRSTEPNH